jgi:(4S)-4-hydroxy-5-phosphonooxypentane-2,3-dione isomerase
MHVVTVKFSVKPDSFDSFLTLVRRQRQASLTQSRGCRTFDIAHDGTAQVFLYELYDHAADFANHLHTPHFRTFAAATTEMVVTKEVIEWQLDMDCDAEGIPSSIPGHEVTTAGK